MRRVRGRGKWLVACGRVVVGRVGFCFRSVIGSSFRSSRSFLVRELGCVGFFRVFLVFRVGWRFLWEGRRFGFYLLGRIYKVEIGRV